MHAAITGSGKYKYVYVMESYRNDQGKVSKRTYRDLGSSSNRAFTSLGNLKYVIAHSLKRIKKTS